MATNKSRLFCSLGVALGAALFGASAQAHECRALGQSQNEQIGQYWVCVGFSVEDGDRPRAGTLNNLDFIPLWVPGNPHAAGGVATQHALPDEPLDTRTGDKVDIHVKLVHLKGDYYEIEHDADYNLLDPWFFLKQAGTGYSNPLSNTRYARPLPWLTPVDLDEDGEHVVTYRSPWDFITPFPGLYAWVIEGTLRRQGQAPVRFMEKFVSAQPRIPYGPGHVDGHHIDDLMGAPEGWFDAVRPHDGSGGGGGHPHAAKASSPTVSAVMKRLRKK